MSFRHFANDTLYGVVALISVSKIVCARYEGRTLVIDNQIVRLVAQCFLRLFEVAHDGLVKKLWQGLRGHRHTIDREFFVQVSNLVTRNSHHPFDVIHTGARGVTKNHHITARDGRALGQFEVEHWQTNAVVKFIDQNQVAHPQGWNHGPRWNFEGLK